MNTHRTKLLAAGMAVLLAGAAALLFAPSAVAAEWHAYEGDVYPGHAYGLQVPAEAESIELRLDGAENATASVAVYDPAGARLGHYALSSGLTTASVAGPREGRYVIYVYELTGGALDLRVNAPAAPALDLQKMPLVREDVPISSSDRAARLDAAITAQLKAPAVFLTLLYEGSAEALDATVSSQKGAVMTVTGESGTAFAPGVYSSLSGSRRLDAANLEGTLYTVEVHAQSFEGTLYLTTLAVDFATPVPKEPVARTPKAPEAPEAPKAPETPWNATGGATFAFGEGKAYAFHAAAGELLLADPSIEKKDARDHSRARAYGLNAVSVYAPNDTLLAYVVIEDERAQTRVKLPVEGEYVAFVHHARDEVVLAKLAGANAAPALRELSLVAEEHVFGATDFLGGQHAEFELARAPVMLHLDVGDAPDALTGAYVENEHGMVASHSSLARLPGLDPLAWSDVDPANFRAGAHTFSAHGLLGGSEVVLTAVSYLRHVAHEAEHDAEHDAHEAGHGEHEEEAHRTPLAPVTLAPIRAPALPAIPGLYG